MRVPAPRGCAPSRVAAYRARAAVAALTWTATSCGVVATAPAESGLAPYQVVADGIPASLTTAAGDAARGRTLIVARDAANCVLCHAVPDAAVRFSGDLGPSLAGVGARLSVAQLRLRVVDNLRLNPATAMPSYYRIEGLERVASPYQGKPILTAGEVEDVVAYLAALQ